MSQFTVGLFLKVITKNQIHYMEKMNVILTSETQLLCYIDGFQVVCKLIRWSMFVFHF